MLACILETIVPDISLINSQFVVKNITPNKAVRLLNIVSLQQGEQIDLLDQAGVSESQLLEALRSPNGSLFKQIRLGQIKILHCNLITLQNLPIQISDLVLNNSPKDGQILSYADGKLNWVENIAGEPAEKITVAEPLHKDGPSIWLDRASATNSGYLAKDDWLLFSGRHTGQRVWQYQDFKSDGSSYLFKLNKLNGQSIQFNIDYLVPNSAIVVDQLGKSLYSKKGFFNKCRTNLISVVRHIGDQVEIDKSPLFGQTIRVYFLINVPAGIGNIEYVSVPKQVRNERIELTNSTDIDCSSGQKISGDKIFLNDVQINKDLNTSNTITGKLSVRNDPGNHYLLGSNSVGDGAWVRSPYVADTAPPSHYDGQIWVRTPEYEIYVYDAIRKKWLSAGEQIIISGNLQAVQKTNEYITCLGATTLPYDCTLVSMLAQADNSAGWSAQVHIRNQHIVGAEIEINPTTNYAYSNSLNINFEAGQRVRLYCSGINIDNPTISVIFKKTIK